MQRFPESSMLLELPRVSVSGVTVYGGGNGLKLQVVLVVMKVRGLMAETRTGGWTFPDLHEVRVLMCSRVNRVSGVC
jgi:hypothetical protein